MTCRGLLFASSVIIAALAAQYTHAQEPADPAEFGALLSGCGGVYFLAEPGELVVEVLKRDRNVRDVRTEMRLLLVGPDRTVLDEAFIPDDGQRVDSGLGPPQTATLRTMVERPGIYALNVTVSNDRYGTNIRWGFRTNAERYVVETARGHRDRRHEEPIVLGNPEMSAVVAFHPRNGEFSIEVLQTPAGSAPPTLLTGDGEQVGVLEHGEGNVFALTVPAAERREAIPWQLHVPAAHCEIYVDGLTRWEPGDPIVDSCIWTPHPESWFPFIENRWLLTPYSRRVHGDRGAEGELRLRAHNNATVERTFALSVDFPEGEWSLEPTVTGLTLGPNEAAQVPVRYEVPADGPRVAHLRITPEDTPEVSTYSTLTVVPGEAPAARPLQMPLTLAPYEHENEQFGYLPDYPVNHQPYFDPQNRPYMRTAEGIATWRDGEWVETPINDAVTSRPEALEGHPVHLPSTKIAFDRDGGIYLPASIAGGAALLHSMDGGRTFAAYEVPGGRGTIDIDQFSGHNISEGPPPFVFFQRTAADPDLRWRSINDLRLFVPRMVDGELQVGEPVLITEDCIGLSAHSGIPSSLASRGDLIHVAWGEATDPAEEVPGVPTFVATWDRDTETLSEPALIGYGPPPNDVHNSPSITMDSEGTPHVLIGTHGRPFQYSRPLADGTGWTDPVLAGEGLRQTYIGFVCDPDHTLHVVFRLWQTGEPFPLAGHATLAYQRKRPGEPWEEPRILVRAPFSEYSIFYHRLTIDRDGRLFLSYDYWSTHWFYRNDHVGNRRGLLMSPDGGDSWALASNEDLVGAIR